MFKSTFSVAVALSLLVVGTLLLISSSVTDANPLMQTFSQQRGHNKNHNKKHQQPPVGGNGMTLQRIVFAHRHGSRTASMNVGGNCGDIGCFNLNTQGQKMLENIGKAFATRYGHQLFGTNPATGKPNYDFRSMKIVSDESNRVIQSANAFWRGMWGSNDGATSIGAPHIPVIQTNAENIIDAANNAAFRFHIEATWNEATRYSISKSIFSEKLIDMKTIRDIGVEIGLDPEFNDCSTEHILDGSCSMFADSFLHLMVPVYGKSKWTQKYPLGAKYIKPLDQLRINAQHELWNGLYDKNVLNSSYYEVAGFPGAALFNAMLTDAANEDLKFSEFSGHDSSLMGLWGAMDNASYPYPRCGSAVTFEVYQNDDDGSLFVKAIIAVPNQWPESGFETVITPHALTCIDSNGRKYVTDDGCPLEDLQRLMQSRAGKALTDPCYVWPADLQKMNCGPTSPPTSSQLCAGYRAKCPLSACGEGYYTLKNLSCSKL